MKTFDVLLSKLSDIELDTLINEMKKSSIPEDAICRRIIAEAYGDEVGIFILRVNELLWPLVLELQIRFKERVSGRFE